MCLGRPIRQGQIYDPLTTRTVNGQTLRDPFPGNIIPVSRFDSVAKNIIPLFPKQNRPGTFRNYQTSAGLGSHSNQWGAKIDHSISDWNKLNGSVAWSKRFDNGLAVFPSPLGVQIGRASCRERGE